MSDEINQYMKGGFCGDSAEMKAQLEELQRALEAGELASFAMRLYKDDDTYEDVFYSVDGEHSLDELRQALKQQIESMH